MISAEKIEEVINKIHNQNWQGYKLYFIGGVLNNKETKDIDIFITGSGDEEKLVKSIKNIQERGLVDFFVVDYIDENEPNTYYLKRFAKTYPKYPHDFKKEHALYWRNFINKDCKCGKKTKRNYTQKPVLIYNGVI
tara:strand:- start:12740 stop:13147 length:408 start_codon:yes stop_codon:yes gene_type:complete